MDNKAIKKGKDTRKKIYDFIKAYIQENQYPPTTREIGDGVGLASTNTIYNQLHKLKEMGVITFLEGQPRTIRILSEFVEQ